MKRFAIRFLVAVLSAVVAFFVLSRILEFRPDEEMGVDEYFHNVDPEIGGTLPDTLRIVSWNIGYAGLGDNMDFCVDGGTRVRDSEERTRRNLCDIISELKKLPADIYLLQEVDRDAHRTYGINEIEALAEVFPDYLFYYTPNFKVWFVPSPLKEPIGYVDAGLVIMTGIRPSLVRRIQYPSAFPFPVSMFNLKRCLLEADFVTCRGAVLHLGNTHCTAFDTGGMRTAENIFLKDRLSEYARKGEEFIVGGDWNQYPPQYKPSREELENEFFVPELFDTTRMDSYARVVCDVTRRSMRFNDRPYSENSTTSILDFFVTSKESPQVVDMHIVDLGFHSSDHNPVYLKMSF